VGYDTASSSGSSNLFKGLSLLAAQPSHLSACMCEMMARNQHTSQNN
jgi:hypothetical protein